MYLNPTTIPPRSLYYLISMDMEDRNGDHAVAGVIQTATAIVNAIPAVVKHTPGLVAAMELPKITGKGLYRPRDQEMG